MSRNLHIAALAAAATLAVAVMGCGKEQVSSEELVQKGDDICRDGQERFAEIQAEPPSNASDAADQTGDLLDEAEGNLDDLRNLEPPEDQRDPYDRYLDARESVNDLYQRGKDAADDQDADAYGKAQAEVASGAPERRKLARALGFKVCSQGQSAGLP